jgi:hypothetical protein
MSAGWVAVDSREHQGEEPEVKRRVWAGGLYLGARASTSPEYALSRVVAFGLMEAPFLVLGIVVQPALGLFGLFCLFAVLVWWRRWRRALRERNSHDPGSSPRA